jgi:hypothetical protein
MIQLLFEMFSPFTYAGLESLLRPQFP